MQDCKGRELLKERMKQEIRNERERKGSEKRREGIHERWSVKEGGREER
jgi:hypothetical protein